ncbi:MAG: glucokinase [Ardenticatenaceae bacterium]|nr:glucokinase [Ardenticatenaceae bacterium]MCB9443433.1 glucokinase [Ardenticatenaceae bacterium]
MNVLVGDLGGTKTILAVATEEMGPHKLLNEQSFPSARYDSLEMIIREYLNGSELAVERACLAVAGPIENGRYAHITNLSWFVNADALCETFALSSVRLINDLEAVAYAIPVLEPADIHTLHEGTPVDGGSLAVLAPGTGLGEGFLTLDSTGTYQAHASEGSHVSFGPTNVLQMDLLTYMREVKGFDHVSYERVCSGALGLPNLYDFLKENGRFPEPPWLVEKLANSEDPTPIIIEAAQDQINPCVICAAALALFCDILAAEAGNLALKVLSTGGIYLGGGIPPRILAELEKPGFLEILRNKGRFREILSKMPVKVILNAKAGLLGAATCGLQSI